MLFKRRGGGRGTNPRSVACCVMRHGCSHARLAFAVRDDSRILYSTPTPNLGHERQRVRVLRTGKHSITHSVVVAPTLPLRQRTACLRQLVQLASSPLVCVHALIRMMR